MIVRFCLSQNIKLLKNHIFWRDNNLPSFRQHYNGHHYVLYLLLGAEEPAALVQNIAFHILVNETPTIKA